MTVVDLRERMPAAEFLHWHTYYRLLAQRDELEAKRRG